MYLVLLLKIGVGGFTFNFDDGIVRNFPLKPSVVFVVADSDNDDALLCLRPVLLLKFVDDGDDVLEPPPPPVLL